MRVCRTLQIVLGIFSALITIALCAIAVLVILPFVGFEIDAVGILHTAVEGLKGIINVNNLTLQLVLVCAIFGLPTILMVVASNLTLFGTKHRSCVAGCILGFVALAIFGAFTGIFSHKLVGDLQMIYLITLGAVVVVYVILSIAYFGSYKKVKSTVQTTESPAHLQPPLNQTEDTPTDGTTDADTDESTQEQTVEQTDDGEVLFMAQDYSSVSDISDSTYEHNDVLSPKTLEKLKIARDLYEKGVISKEEYLNIVQKYLDAETANGQ